MEYDIFLLVFIFKNKGLFEFQLENVNRGKNCNVAKTFEHFC